ncbi:MAG: helix-turn-helix transcriptional regulator [Gammaproteobacteria bacterium]|nr:helix-turn-helix transcriptional regulator [Gammaproteobacteria bacterium]
MKNTTEIEQEITDLALRKIVENVKRERKKQKMSQLNLAMAMGHESVGLISFIEAGINNRRYNLIHLISIAKILDISILELFEGVDEILQTKQ